MNEEEKHLTKILNEPFYDPTIIKDEWECIEKERKDVSVIWDTDWKIKIMFPFHKFKEIWKNLSNFFNKFKKGEEDVY
jgi:hypothetical protein